MIKNQFDGYAVSKYVMGSAYKFRKVADEIRGKNVHIALQLLKTMPQRAAGLIYKTLYSAYSNAVNNNGINKESLFVDSIMIDAGPHLKRFQPRARGRGFAILKGQSHIKVGLKSRTGVANGSKS